MVVSTALMIAGAVAGATGGGIANKKRIDAAEAQDVIAKRRLEASRRAKAAYAKILEGDMTVGALEATATSRQAAEAAFQERSKGEAAAGTSGVTAGTPIYQLGKFAADAQDKLAEVNTQLGLKIQGMRAQGEANMGSYDDQRMEIEAGVGAIAKEMNYLNGPLAWALSVGSGAIAGAQVGANIGTSLEKLGVDTGKELFPKKAAADVAAVEGAYSPVSVDMESTFAKPWAAAERESFGRLPPADFAGKSTDWTGLYGDSKKKFKQMAGSRYFGSSDMFAWE